MEAVRDIITLHACMLSVETVSYSCPCCYRRVGILSSAVFHLLLSKKVFFGLKIVGVLCVVSGFQRMQS